MSVLLIKQVVTKAGYYEHKTGRRKVRIKVGGWLHVALDALNEAGSDGMNRHNVLPGFALCWTAKPLEKLLRYGLIDCRLRVKYWIKLEGRKVLRQLDWVKPITLDATQEFDCWRTWKDVLNKTGEYSHKGYRMVTVEIPGSPAWEDHFSTRTW